MKHLTLLSLALIFLFIGGWAYHIHAENEKLKDPEFIYQHYLKPYEAENCSILGAQFELNKGSLFFPWEPSWDIYLYSPRGKLIELAISARKTAKKEISTVINYSTLSLPLASIREIPVHREGVILRAYLPDGNRLKEYSEDELKCVNLSAALDNRTLKLLQSLRGRKWLDVVNTTVGGVFALTTSNSPLCQGSWMVITPYSPSQDKVEVLYPHGNASGFTKPLESPTFNGEDYLNLLKELRNHTSTVTECVLVNATGIYVNPHAQEIFNRTVSRAIKEKRCFTIDQVIVLKNGTVKTWGRGTVWCARRY